MSESEDQTESQSTESTDTSHEHGEACQPKEDQNGDQDDTDKDEQNGDQDASHKSTNGDSQEQDEDKVNSKDKENNDEDCEVVDEETNGDVITVDDKGEDVPSKTISDTAFFENVSEEEKQFYEDKAPSQESLENKSISCTACFKQVNHHLMNSIMRHPLLGVAICKQCRYWYDGDGSDGQWEKDEDGVDMFCRWCGQGGEVLGCDDCKFVFCKKCITRNLGRGKFAEINDADKWSCFSCDPSQIYKERALMFALVKWMSELKLKTRLKAKLKSEKKKTEVLKKKVEERRKQKEVKFEQEASKVDNFVDEAFHEALETLNIYQKCLNEEQKKWIKQRKNMNPNNTAAIVKSLRKIFSITKQNMELLDTTLVQGYNMVYPDESDRKIKITGMGDLDNSVSNKTPVKTPTNKRKRKAGGDDIEVEEIVVNGENVLDNMDDEGFDPSLLCSVEITPQRGDSDSEPETKRPKVAPPRGPLKLSNSMFKKKKKSPLKMKKRPKKTSDEIEEITLTDEEDDENSTGYVTQSEVNQNTKKRKQQVSQDDDDSDVSLE